MVIRGLRLSSVTNRPPEARFGPDRRKPLAEVRPSCCRRAWAVPTVALIVLSRRSAAALLVVGSSPPSHIIRVYLIDNCLVASSMYPAASIALTNGMQAGICLSRGRERDSERLPD